MTPGCYVAVVFQGEPGLHTGRDVPLLTFLISHSRDEPGSCTDTNEGLRNQEL